MPDLVVAEITVAPENVPADIKKDVPGTTDAEIDFVMGKSNAFDKCACTHSPRYDEGDVYEIDRRMALRYVQKMRPDLQPTDEKDAPTAWPSQWGDSVYLYRGDKVLKLLTKAEAQAIVAAKEVL
jgi:hypothetical protein